MKKVLLTATVQSHICQFHKPLAEMLHQKGYEVHVAAKDNLAEKQGLSLDFADKVFDVPFSRSPKSKDNLAAYKALKKIIAENGYDVIHCNTPMGGIVTRLAARRARRKGTKVIYTAHGFHFYNGAPKSHWLFYYPIEKMMAKYTDVLITINEEDYALARKKLKVPKICKMNGVGIPFERLETKACREDVRRELGLAEEDFVLLSVGELNKNKNNIVVLKAMAQLKNPHLKYVVLGNGPLREELEREIEALGLAAQVQFVGYTRDVGKYHKAADAFCFASLREGLGLAAIEAMHSGLPLITSNVHGINDYSKNGVTGFSVAPHSVEEFAKAIQTLMGDRGLCAEMGEHNKRASEIYSDVMAAEFLDKIYTELGE